MREKKPMAQKALNIPYSFNACPNRKTKQAKIRLMKVAPHPLVSLNNVPKPHSTPNVKIISPVSPYLNKNTVSSTPLKYCMPKITATTIGSISKSMINLIFILYSIKKNGKKARNF